MHISVCDQVQGPHLLLLLALVALLHGVDLLRLGDLLDEEVRVAAHLGHFRPQALVARSGLVGWMGKREGGKIWLQ